MSYNEIRSEAYIFYKLFLKSLIIWFEILHFYFPLEIFLNYLRAYQSHFFLSQRFAIFEI